MKKRVLFINGHLNTGGVERSLVDVLRHMDASRYELDLMLLQGAGEYAHEVPSYVHSYIYDLTDTYGPFLQALGLSIKKRSLFLFLYRIAVSMGLSARVIQLFCKPCHKYYDVVISYRTGQSNEIGMYYIHADRRISWWHHGNMNLCDNEKVKLARQYQQADYIVSVSESCSAMLRSEFLESAQKVVTIPNMLCEDEIISKSSEYTPPMQKKFNIVTVGRLSPEKNMLFCLEVAAKLKSQGMAFHWNIIGEGEERSRLEQQMLEMNIADVVTMLGSLPNPYPYVAASDLYFHPSLVESQGLTMLEAMALKTPVVAVASAGAKEFIKSGQNGILIEADTIQAVEAIGLLCGSSGLRKTIIEKGTETTRRFSPFTIMSKIYGITDLKE